MNLCKYVLINLLNYFSSRQSCRDLFVIIGFFFLIEQKLLICSGAVETYPGANSSVRHKIPFVSWTFDCRLARDGFKIRSNEGIPAVHNIDIFVIGESYLSDKVKQQDLLINSFS